LVGDEDAGDGAEVWGAGAGGACGGGRMMGARSSVGAVSVSAASFPGLFEADGEEYWLTMLRSQSPGVDGGAGPHDRIVGAPADSRKGGMRAAARRRQKSRWASGSGPDSLRAWKTEKIWHQFGSAARWSVHRSR
jgi:hypothetical protein